MKNMLAILAVFALGGAAFAQDTPTPGGGKNRPSRQERRKALKEKYDANHDGKLDDAERAALKAAVQEKAKAKRAELFKKLDTDGDGKLSQAELEKGHADKAAARQQRREELKKKFDKNGDGKLDEQERAEAKKALKEHRKGKAGRKHGGRK